MEMAYDFLHECADFRRSGSAAMDLAYLACGRHDVFFEMRLKPWDYAAGSLVVQEAGGKFMMPLLDDVNYDMSTAVLAANAACMEKALEVFRRHCRCDRED
jgi:myo-inositol-1(or 4)-monophosphatase